MESFGKVDYGPVGADTRCGYYCYCAVTATREHSEEALPNDRDRITGTDAVCSLSLATPVVTYAHDRQSLGGSDGGCALS